MLNSNPNEIRVKFGIQYDPDICSDEEVRAHERRIQDLLKTVKETTPEAFVNMAEEYARGIPGIRIIREEDISPTVLAHMNQKLDEAAGKQQAEAKKPPLRWKWGRRNEVQHTTAPDEKTLRFHPENCTCLKDYQEMTQSRDAVEAATGRFLLKFHPVLIEWGQEEIARGTPEQSYAMLGGMCRGFTMQMADIVTSSAKSSGLDPRMTLRAVRDAIARDIDHIADHPDLELSADELRAKRDRQRG